MQRVLSVSLSHVVRSAALLLLPFSFIALIAWATAGSATGSTTDPIRGALWIWVGAHHIPFTLKLPPTSTPGYFSYLPLAGIVLPFLTIRSAFNRALDRLQGDFHDINGVRLIFSVQYAALLTIAAFVSRSYAIAPQWYFAPLFGILIAFVATMTCGYRIRLSQPVIEAARLVSIILGISTILFGIAIFLNFHQVKDITTTLQPGIFGGALLLFLNLLYIPSAAVATASYLAGSGFAVGAGTLVSPLWHHLGQIPALPLLGTLPTQRNTIAVFGIALFALSGALLVYRTFEGGIQLVLQSFLFVVIAIILLAYLSSGSLMTSEMGSIGVSIWKFGLTSTLEMALGAGAMLFALTKVAK